MPKDCCPRIVITQNKLILAFSVNAAFKLKIELSIFSRHYTVSLIYNFLQAVAENKRVKMDFCPLRNSQDSMWAEKKAKSK